MREHISPDELWLALERLRDAGWTDQEIIEQVRNIATSSCKRWLISRGYILETDDPLNEYPHLHFTETLEDRAVVVALQALDGLDVKLYDNSDIFGSAFEAMRVVTALSYVGFSTEDFLSQQEAKNKVKAQLGKIRPLTKYDKALQEVIDGLVEEGDTFADLAKTIRSITEKTEGPLDCDDYYYHKNEDGEETFRWMNRTGYEGNYKKLSSLRPYHKRAKEKFNKKD